MKREILKTGIIVSAFLSLPIVFSATVHADRFTSTNYTIDASAVGNSFGGSQTSTNYNLVGSGGESVVGNGAGGSYKLTQGYVAQLDKSLQLTVQPGGLAAYYPMDEGSGTAVNDASINNKNGAAINQPSWGAGKLGTGLTLNGSSQYVDTGSTMAYGAFTVSGWLYPTVSGGTQMFVSNSRDCCGTYKGFEIETSYTGNNISFKVWSTDGSSNNSISGGTVDLNQWNFITASYDGSTMKIFKNGTLINSQAYSSTSPLTPSSNLMIGRIGAAPAGYFGGTIDEVKIYNRVLTDKEVKAEYNAGVAGVSAGLAFATNIDAGVSQTAAFDAVMQTDAPGYSLAINQNQNLTNGANTIPAVSGSIASPVAWSEGTTKGLGFSLIGTNATALPGKWSSGNAYAALPGSATSFYTRTGYTGGTKDYINMRLRLDVATAQVTGNYTNQMTITGTMTP